MTAEEKEKLYTAIGYSGSSHNLALPRKVNTPAICMLVGFVGDKFKFPIVAFSTLIRANYIQVNTVLIIRL